MRTDLYTKTILTIIALLLAVIVLKPFVTPSIANAQTSLNGIQVSFGGTGLWFFDTKTGDIWVYSMQDLSDVTHVGKIVELGKPIVTDKQK
jgi:hypothetical protein